MNPPFEKKQDIKHVLHAYDCLQPGGRLVAIMSEGTFFRNGELEDEFKILLDETGRSEKLPCGAFKKSGTGVAVRLVVMDK